MDAESLRSAFAGAADRFVARAQQEQVVGGALYFMVDGKVAGARHFGMADEDAEQAIDAETIYHWASITKTFTAIGAMQLVQRDLIKLDDPVTRYIPELAAVHNPFGSAADITVRHLLTHSSGLRSRTWPWNSDGAAAAADAQPHEPTQWTQLVAMMPYTAVAFAPGSRYSYSNLGTTLLGRIVEIVTGDDIEVYLDKNVLRPLGMTRTYFDVTPYHLSAHRSNSYTVRDGKRIAHGREFDTGVTVGNGGLNAPIGDMGRYLNFLLGIGDAGLYENILPRATLLRMWEPLFAANSDTTDDERMAQSFFTIDARGADGKMRRYVGHTGSQQGYRSFFYILPQAKAAAILVVNTTVAVPRPLLYDTRRDLFERVFPLVDHDR